MRLERVHISNFRSLRDVTVAFGSLTILIGANSSGKTSVLEALRLFGAEGAAVGREDFFSEEPVKITLTLDPGKGHDIPTEFLHNGRVVVQKAFELPEEGETTGSTLIEKMCCKDFLDIRNAPRVRDRQAMMKELARTHRGFPSPKDSWPEALDEYERDRMSGPDHAEGYGWHFIPVEQGPVSLDELLPSMYVQAMRDIPADARDDGKSALGKLLDLTVRKSKKREAAMREIMDEAAQKIRQSLDGLNLDAGLLSRQMSGRFAPYVDDASLSIEFTFTGLKNPRPQARLTLLEDGLPVSMERAGSGLQRIGLLILLDTLYSLREGGAAGQGGGEGGAAGQG
ncbi:MAG: AAA family ATPase, partial [Thaumarchaeota archaeon]|nr:AAA family ATPase [Nitrososphaerota archaeon]